MKSLKIYTLLLFVLISFGAFTQTTISGKVLDDKQTPLPGANIVIIQNESLHTGTQTDKNGYYSITVKANSTQNLKFSFVGYKTVTRKIEVKQEKIINLDIILTEDLLNLDKIVVTGIRRKIAVHEAPVIVNTIDQRMFESTQSTNLAEGLNFTPGLRVETNCQNCGFSQLRINGLEGAYSQILINNRQVFSALVGVYGLDMIPTNMIDRVEIIRGSGSAIYGGNAIGGTVNIITKDPIKNAFEIGINQGFIGFKIPNRTIHFNGSLVSADLNKGINIYGFNRMRNFYDANNDGFSELTMLRNTTVGFNSFWNPSSNGRLAINFNAINEFRRGGNKFDLYPHQTDITEQLKHRIIGGDISYEHFFKNRKHKLSIYTSGQFTNRNSYYGGGGRVITSNDTLKEDDLIAINSYGKSDDIALSSGIQYNGKLHRKVSLATGIEHLYNKVEDEMPGYNRQINQKVHTVGTFAQIEYSPIKKLSFLVGGRLDAVMIDGKYNLNGEKFDTKSITVSPVPRITAKYEIIDGLRLRFAYAQGYRTPQAFDEDLHIETVGGAARFVRISKNLKNERSNSFNLSINYDKNLGKNWQINTVADGFFTILKNPFITTNPKELPSGVSVVEKINGDGSKIYGVNLEFNMAYKNKLLVQSALTLQQARYDKEEEIWSPEPTNSIDKATVTKNILKTPNAYGYVNVTYMPIKPLTLSLSNVFTGSMQVPHVVDAATEKTILKKSPIFAEMNFKIQYKLYLKKDFYMKYFAGMHNILNSYQKDFDTGADRDAAYVYGPTRPRTLYLGINIGLD